jgi:4-amino-4-deoxy-L-arabinose transferase-like glycosyltransferase
MRTPGELLRARPWLWIPLMAIPIAAWLAAIASDPRGYLLRVFLVDNHLNRFLGGEGWIDRGHRKPPWYYFLQLPLMFLPWTLALAAAGRWIWSRRREAAERFLLS